MNKIGIIGSRRRDSIKDFSICKEAFFSIYHKGDIIVSGGCPKGGDRFAQIIAEQHDIPITIHYPDKSKLDPEKLKQNSKWAYAEINYARNTLIAQDSDTLLCVVSPDRKGGTEDTIKKAKKMGKLIIIVHGEGVKTIDQNEVLYVHNPAYVNLPSDAISLKEFDPYSI